MWLSNSVVEGVGHTVDEIFFVSHATAMVLNQERDKSQPIIFSGWYWAKGSFEAGPFRSMSAAYRDAWFRLVHRRPAPRIHAEAAREIRAQERAHRREQQQPRVRGAA